MTETSRSNRKSAIDIRNYLKGTFWFLFGISNSHLFVDVSDDICGQVISWKIDPYTVIESRFASELIFNRLQDEDIKHQIKTKLRDWYGLSYEQISINSKEQQINIIFNNLTEEEQMENAKLIDKTEAVLRISHGYSNHEHNDDIFADLRKENLPELSKILDLCIEIIESVPTADIQPFCVLDDWSMISSAEVCHRICNGFISHDGFVDGRFTDIFVDNGYGWDFDNVTFFSRVLGKVIDILSNLPKVTYEEE